MTTGPELYRTAKKRIPGGTQLLSKRPERILPDQWPAYYERAAGVEVWDVSGKRYVDMSYNGIGASILGYADPDVSSAVRTAVDKGVVSTLNCPEEVELADLLCELHPWAEMVRYARTGGEAMAIAVRLARARTGKDVVAFCGYHGWHDWYLAANLGDGSALDGHLIPGLPPRGVPRALRGTAFPFHYNRLDELEAIVQKHGSDLAAIVMEPMRGHDPEPGFLEGVRALADRTGAVLVLDEVTAAFRMNTGGLHLRMGLRPDIAVFAKAMANGHPMAAILGTAEVMRAAEVTFVSSTAWTDRIGPVAALATIRKHRKLDAGRILEASGRRVQQAWTEAARKADLPVEVGGLPPLAHFEIQAKNAAAAHTLFTQLMLEKGYLATNSFYCTTAHTAPVLAPYGEAVAEAFAEIARHLRTGRLEGALKGPVREAGFARLT